MYGCGIALVALAGLMWIGGKWSAEHGIAYVFSDNCEFEDRKSVVAAVEVTAGTSAIHEWRTVFPFVARSVARDKHSVYVQLGVSEEVDGAARITSAAMCSR